MGKRRKMMNGLTGAAIHIRFASAAFLAVSVLAGCDEAKKPYEEAVALEQSGDLASAADKFDAICKRWPKSKYCGLAVEHRAADLLDLGAQQIRMSKFDEAESTLVRVQEIKGPEWGAKAKALLESPDMVMGKRWKSASDQLDKLNAKKNSSAAEKMPLLPEIEGIAASSAFVAPLAADWIKRERASVLLSHLLSPAGCGPGWVDAEDGKVKWRLGEWNELISEVSAVSACRQAYKLVLEKAPNTDEVRHAREAMKLAALTACNGAKGGVEVNDSSGAPFLQVVWRPKPCSSVTSRNCAALVGVLQETAAGSDEAKEAAEYLRKDERRCGKPPAP